MGLVCVDNALCFLMATRTTRAGIIPPTIAWAPLHQSSIKKQTYKLAYRPTLWRYFSQVKFLFLK